MKRKYILTIFTLSMGLHFAFPQVTTDGVVAETIAAESQESICVEELASEPAAMQASEPSYREGMAAYITGVNETVSSREALFMADSILKQAENYGVDEKLILAIAHTESTYYSDAVSSADCKGLMQTGDVLAEEAGYSPDALFDPEVSIAVGTSYIRDQLEAFDQDVELALTAYNQGPGAVCEGDYDISYAEVTMDRVERIEEFLSTGGYAK